MAQYDALPPMMRKAVGITHGDAKIGRSYLNQYGKPELAAAMMLERYQDLIVMKRDKN